MDFKKELDNIKQLSKKSDPNIALDLANESIVKIDEIARKSRDKIK